MDMISMGKPLIIKASDSSIRTKLPPLERFPFLFSVFFLWSLLLYYLRVKLFAYTLFHITPMILFLPYCSGNFKSFLDGDQERGAVCHGELRFRQHLNLSCQFLRNCQMQPFVERRTAVKIDLILHIE